MKQIISSAIVMAAVTLSPVLQAEEAAPSAPVRASEYRPSPSDPQVVIRSGEKETYYEYRVNGELKEIRVEPEVGPVYYLVPADNGGFIRQDGSQLVVPSWVLFRW
ncbi:MAG: hypothetical protein CL581_16785 [Alteromonadaceae bacterium]|mgnify:CR=1 FL=1|nr:hypothetical protein [Alteromonadaceae bacterium]MBH85271.1 hypothetical protein [Alteromonadaceae bacterium]|tara:strand:+ start:663 stop:980 length:318 start_codon:yes stop_codon:yes gene_type:complete